MAGADGLVGRFRGQPCLGLVDGDEGVEGGVAPLDALLERLGVVLIPLGLG